MSCPGGSALGVGYFLGELSVDHLFKADHLPLFRKPVDLANLFVRLNPARDEALLEVLTAMPSARFDKLDASTGTFELKLEEQPREITVRGEVTAPLSAVTVKLPPRLSGGYWRTPGVLELVFWDANRATVVTESDFGSHEVTVECVSISPQGFRVVTAGDDVPDVLFSYAACQ